MMYRIDFATQPLIFLDGMKFHVPLNLIKAQSSHWRKKCENCCPTYLTVPGDQGKSVSESIEVFSCYLHLLHANDVVLSEPDKTKSSN